MMELSNGTVDFSDACSQCDQYNLEILAESGKTILQQVWQRGKAVSRLHTIWTDGGFDGEPFMHWVICVCRWIVQVVLRPQQTKGLSCSKTLGGRAHGRLAHALSSLSSRL